MWMRAAAELLLCIILWRPASSSVWQLSVQHCLTLEQPGDRGNYVQRRAYESDSLLSIEEEGSL